MSMRQVLDLVEALLADETVGLRPTVERLAVSLPNAPQGAPGPLSVDFNFMRAPLDGELKPTTRGNVSITPDRWITNPQLMSGAREGTASVFIDFESSSASRDDLVDEATLVATATAQCLVDGLRLYSEVRQTQYGMTVADVAPGVDVAFRYWDGPMTYGFRMIVTIEEYANE